MLKRFLDSIAIENTQIPTVISGAGLSRLEAYFTAGRRQDNVSIIYEQLICVSTYFNQLQPLKLLVSIKDRPMLKLALHCFNNCKCKVKLT